MALLVILLIAVFVSVLIVRVSARALMRTGMSREMAEFQALSAFTTVGFTTAEAESAVNHPVRRRIVMLLMLLGNVGLVTVLGSGIVSFITVAGAGSYIDILTQIAWLLAGLGTIWFIFSSRFVDRILNGAVDWAVGHWSDLEARDYVDLLHLTEGYSVTEMVIDDNDWLIGHTLSMLRLADVGVNVLAIVRADGEFIGAPMGHTLVEDGDQLIIYGSAESILDLDAKRSGDENRRAHMERVAQTRDLKRATRAQESTTE